VPAIGVARIWLVGSGKLIRRVRVGGEVIEGKCNDLYGVEGHDKTQYITTETSAILRSKLDFVLEHMKTVCDEGERSHGIPCAM
jgi:hypothetical protein